MEAAHASATLLSDPGCREVPRDARRLRVRCPNTAVHVGLDLGRAQRSAVDADFVDEACEPFRVHAVSADAKRAAGGGHGAGDCECRRLDAVDVEPQVRSVVRRREVRPGVEWQLSGPAQVPFATDEDLCIRPLRVFVRVEGVHDVPDRFLEQDSAPAVAQRAWPHPAHERHPTGEVERRRIGDGDHVVHAVEVEGGADLSAAFQAAPETVPLFA